MTYDFSWNEVVFGDNSAGLALKIQSAVIELNIWFRPEELEQLNNLENTKWENGSLKIGESANSPVWWSSKNNDVTILIGNDDETWDIALSIPTTEILKAIKLRYDT